VAGARGRTVEGDEAASFEDAVDDGFGQVGVVKNGTPGSEGLVGSEDHGTLLEMSIVDDVEQDIGSVVAVGKIADFVELC